MMPMMISYSKAVNKDMHRVGPIFQDSFKAKRITTTEQLVHLSRYIHLNPVRAGLVTTPEEWQYSSYQDYIGLREGTMPKMEYVLSDFTDRQEYIGYVETWQDEGKIQEVLFNEI